MQKNQNIFRNIVTSGIEGANENEKVRKAIIINSFHFVGLLAMTTFIINGIITQQLIYTLILALFWIITLTNALVLRKTKNLVVAGNMVVAFMLLLDFALLFRLGEGTTGVFWFYILPLLSIFTLGKKNGLFYIIILLVVAVIYMKISNHAEYSHLLAKYNQYPKDFPSRFMFTYIFVTILSYVFELIRENTYFAFVKADRQKTGYLNQVLQQKEEILAQADLLRDTNTELEKLSIVASKTNNAIVIMDSEGRFEWVNEAFYNLYGIGLDELKQKGETILEANSSDDIDIILKGVFKDKKPCSYQYHTENPNGDKIWVKTTITPILDADNQIFKLIAIDSDITEIIIAEQKIIQKSEEILAQNEEINAQREELEDKNEAILAKNEFINGSIRYAKTIQSAILPFEERIGEYFENFILFKPKDVVSGDFYWYVQANNYHFVAVVDCTGHGVPGAFMSMIGSSLLNQIVYSDNEYNTANILTKLNELVIFSLRQKQTDNNDGMDVCLCRIEKGENKSKIQFTGAKRPLFYIPNGSHKIERLKGDRKSIGGTQTKKNIVGFTTQEFEAQKYSTLYLSSDGFIDQNNFERKKYGTGKLITLLENIYNKDLKTQHEIFNTEIENWMNRTEQRDDITLLGIKI